MIRTKELGDQGEIYAQELLKSKGHDANLLTTNYPTYDIEVVEPKPFLVSVKTSDQKQHVRLGSLNSVERLSAGNFVFAFMPVVGKTSIELRPGGYRLLILPAEVVKQDAFDVMKAYVARGGKASFSYIVKGYSRYQYEVWSRWAEYEEAWHLLPK